MQFKKTSSGTDCYLFDSMGEYFDFLEPSCYPPRASDAEFAGLDSYTYSRLERVRGKAEGLWQEGMDVLHRLVEQLENAVLPEIKDHKRRVTFNEDDGDEVDYDRLRAGQAYWRLSKRQAVSGPTTVTILIETSALNIHESMDLLWRGAAAIAIAKILEERGFSTEIWAVTYGNAFASDAMLLTACCLKRCSDRLDVSTLVNYVSGWFYRSAAFTAYMTIEKRSGKEVKYAYGQSKQAPAGELDAISSDEHRIYSAGVFTFNGAIAMMKAELERLAASDF